MNEPLSLGRRGEDIAVSFLEEAGYTIRHRNWRSGRKEVDIIAENNNYVVFVEVKSRTEEFLGGQRESVSPDKQKTIIYAADTYIRKYDINKDCRFDIIFVTFSGSGYTLEHIDNAYYPTLR